MVTRANSEGFHPQTRLFGFVSERVSTKVNFTSSLKINYATNCFIEQSQSLRSFLLSRFVFSKTGSCRIFSYLLKNISYIPQLQCIPFLISSKSARIKYILKTRFLKELKSCRLIKLELCSLLMVM